MLPRMHSRDKSTTAARRMWSCQWELFYCSAVVYMNEQCEWITRVVLIACYSSFNNFVLKCPFSDSFSVLATTLAEVFLFYWRWNTVKIAVIVIIIAPDTSVGRRSPVSLNLAKIQVRTQRGGGAGGSCPPPMASEKNVF